jgi:hypothetical protein
MLDRDFIDMKEINRIIAYELTAIQRSVMRATGED